MAARSTAGFSASHWTELFHESKKMSKTTSDVNDKKVAKFVRNASRRLRPLLGKIKVGSPGQPLISDHRPDPINSSIKQVCTWNYSTGRISIEWGHGHVSPARSASSANRRRDSRSRSTTIFSTKSSDNQILGVPADERKETDLASTLVRILTSFAWTAGLGRVQMEMLFLIIPARNLQRRPDLSFVVPSSAGRAVDAFPQLPPGSGAQPGDRDRQSLEFVPTK